jgi:hypothetical protein
MTVLVAAAVLPVSAAAAERPISGTLTGTIHVSFENCCYFLYGFEGEGVVRGIGKVRFVGVVTEGCLIPGETTCHSGFVVDLLTRTGDLLLDLGSGLDWPSGTLPPPRVFQWTVIRSEGRFAGLSGSGTFDEVSIESGRVVFRLVGVLTSG